ncbi:hypothetical protein DQQ10_00730 [Pseudochryseolinea flava]|uniref:Uncharacterized protein n=1 Tax=Pseudochryseolinea flava TaxID=2059302 RepID=A0A364Y6R9_9BACT|nr:hypothetical protein DQQ10_00730 [Pseudochryseolinea flava]
MLDVAVTVLVTWQGHWLVCCWKRSAYELAATACATTHGAHAATNNLEIGGMDRTQPAKGVTGNV